jgi:hypothetical protein
MLEIDHVILLVPDLDAAGRQLRSEFGLDSIPGGRHAGHGTGNRIVPFGSTYLELMAVVDPAEATASPMGRWVAAHTTTELIPAALCLRTDDIGLIAALLDEVPEAMSRTRPDGSVLAWHLAGLAGMLGPENLPFFIEWHCEPHDHPGATPVDHAADVLGVAEVTIGSPGSLSSIIADAAGVTVASGSGAIKAAVATSNGLITFG